MRRIFVLIALLPLLAPVAAAQAPSVQLTILHTSEHHGNLLSFDTPTDKGVGGVAARATVIAQARAAAGPVLVVDSGDILIGTTMSSVFRGEPDIQAMNLMGYDAMAAGNHEFDYGLDHFRRLQRLARFPIISTSIRGRGQEVAPAFVVKQVGGLRILIFSGVDELTFPESIHPNVVRELEYFDPVSSARGLVRGLGRSVDLIVGVTHMRTDQDLILLQQVPEVGVIVGGHTEGFDGLVTRSGGRPVEAADQPAGVYVKTHRMGATVGRLDLTIEGGRIRRAVARNLPVTSRVAPDPQVAALVKEHQGRLQARFSETIGRATVRLDGERGNVRSRETNLGNLIADVMREFARADVAVMNGGGIRGSFAEGPITLGDTFRVLAFDNTVVTFRLTGAQLREALEGGVSQIEQEGGRFPQVSGLTFVVERARPAGQRVSDVRVGGQPLDTARLYAVATNDFLAGGGDGYTVFRAGRDWRDTQVLLRDLFIEYIRRTATVSARTEGRIVIR
jgi:2',3'-cyclic-nucleotide 2'-phosphodiesterase (5'-nucleotidase family)